MCKIGECKLEKNIEGLDFSEISPRLSGVTTNSYLKHRNKKRQRVATSSALVLLIAGFIVVSPISNTPTIQRAWSAQPETIKSSDKESAEKRCLNEIEVPGVLNGSTVLDYRTGVGVLRLDIAGEFWNCGFSTSNESVSLTKWTEGVTSPGNMVKISGEIDPKFTLNISSNSFDTGVKDFPTAIFMTGSAPEGVTSVKVNVQGLPEALATLSNGIFGIWIPSEGDAEISLIGADGTVIQTLRAYVHLK